MAMPPHKNIRVLPSRQMINVVAIPPQYNIRALVAIPSNKNIRALTSSNFQFSGYQSVFKVLAPTSTHHSAILLKTQYIHTGAQTTHINVLLKGRGIECGASYHATLQVV